MARRTKRKVPRRASAAKQALYLQSIERTAAVIRHGFKTPCEIARARGHVVTLATIYNHLKWLAKCEGVRLQTEAVWTGNFGPAATRYQVVAVPKDAFRPDPSVADLRLEPDPPACHGCDDCT